MLDAWEGETAYMKVDGDIVWSRKGESSVNGINLCGGEHNDAAFNMYCLSNISAIDVTIPHKNSSFKLTFGATLTKDPCNQSFGVDDIMIYAK
jgi:hypothetical protein